MPKTPRRGLPSAILEVIEGAEGFYTDEAEDSVDRLGLEWSDIQQVARTASRLKKERDREAVTGSKYAMQGCDRAGRGLYMAGKVVKCEGEKLWKVITIHEVR